MASSVLQGSADTIQDCVGAMNADINAATVTNVFAQGVVKVGSSRYRYYFIYN